MTLTEFPSEHRNHMGVMTPNPITVADKSLIWDSNMNGDVNGADKIIWSNNNGTSSRVPK